MASAQQQVIPITGHRSRVGEQLRWSEERFRLLAEGVVDHAMFMLDPEGRVVSWNVGAERIKGYRADEILGRHFSCFYPLEEIERRMPRHQLEAASSAGRFEDEGWRIRKDGSRFWANTVITAMRDTSGALRGFVKVTRDLTERKQAEERIRELNQDLIRRTAQVESMNQELEAFVHTVSHDLRVPLRHMEGSTRLLLDELAGVNEAAARLNNIARSATKLGDLVGDLLAYSQANRVSARMESVDLNKIVDDARNNLQLEAGSRRIGWNVATLPAILGDAALLRAVFSNLLSNALKFSRSRDPAIIEIGSYPGEGGESVVFVRDNGVGFDPRFAYRLFGIFQRLHPECEYEGTGIGLATVKRIVERHGGRAWAETTPGQGATFFVSFRKG